MPDLPEVKTMQDIDRQTRLQALADSLDDLIDFAEQEDDFLLAAKVDEVRVHLADRYFVAR
jgi:hypothetical protein